MAQRFTREQYMAKECTHRQYYSQFICDEYIAQMKHMVLRASLEEWDRVSMYLLHSSRIHSLMEEVGDKITLSGAVCIMKEAKRQQLERG